MSVELNDLIMSSQYNTLKGMGIVAIGAAVTRLVNKVANTVFKAEGNFSTGIKFAAFVAGTATSAFIASRFLAIQALSSEEATLIINKMGINGSDGVLLGLTGIYGMITAAALGGLMGHAWTEVRPNTLI